MRGRGQKLMKNLAIIGASYLQLPLIEKAKEMGYTTHVFAWAANDVGELAADHFYPVSIVEKDEILEKCREIGIDGICSIASDLAAVTVNYVASAMGLPGNSMESTRRSTNKHLMRETFREHGDPSPQSTEVDAGTDLARLDLRYPVIVKPTDRSGSRGIFKLEGPEGLAGAVQAALGESFEKKALIEEFAEGEEFSVEGISFHGEHHILALTRKFTTGAPHFVETGHREPAGLDPETEENIRAVVTHALDSLGITDSASQSEIKIDGRGNIRIIEIGGRMGGDCIGSHLVKYSTGIDYVRAVIRVACGEEPDLRPAGEPMAAEVRFIFTEKDVEQRELDRKAGRILEEIAFFPENLGKTTDSSNRAGCYIIRGV